VVWYGAPPRGGKGGGAAGSGLVMARTRGDVKAGEGVTLTGGPWHSAGLWSKPFELNLKDFKFVQTLFDPNRTFSSSKKNEIKYGFE
jgi:hypothetical protein